MTPEHRATLLAGRRARPKEGAADYPHVVVQPIGKLRIIRCPDNLQFIAQRRAGSQWSGFGFFVTVAGARRLPLELRARAVALFEVTA